MRVRSSCRAPGTIHRSVTRGGGGPSRRRGAPERRCAAGAGASWRGLRPISPASRGGGGRTPAGGDAEARTGSRTRPVARVSDAFRTGLVGDEGLHWFIIEMVSIANRRPRAGPAPSAGRRGLGIPRPLSLSLHRQQQGEALRCARPGRPDQKTWSDHVEFARGRGPEITPDQGQAVEATGGKPTSASPRSSFPARPGCKVSADARRYCRRRGWRVRGGCGRRCSH